MPANHVPLRSSSRIAWTWLPSSVRLATLQPEPSRFNSAMPSMVPTKTRSEGVADVTMVSPPCESANAMCVTSLMGEC